MTDRRDIAEHLGLDNYRRVQIEPQAKTCPEPERDGAPVVRNADEEPSDRILQFSYNILTHR